MEATPRQKQHFLLEPGSGFGTFDYDKALPKLPVPSLDQTLEKYLISVRPFVTDEEFMRTSTNCKNFKECTQVQTLQQALVKRSQDKESWLADWWLDYAYLTYRDPLIPCLNVSGPYALTNSGPGQLWPVPVDPSTSLKYVSQFVYHLLQFWKCLRNESLKPDKARDGTRFSMHQFRNLFNSTRIPQKDQDLIMSLWVTQKEGNSPKHIVVLRKGHIYLMEPLIGTDDEPWTAPELEKAFLRICADVDELKDGPAIAALTRDPRDTWAENREYLMKLDRQNLRNLEKIESAMFVVVLDEEEPTSESQACQKLMTGRPENRWADKSLSVVQFANGHGGVNCDHSPIDAMVTVVMSYFIHLGVTDMGGKWPYSEPQTPRQLKEPQLLSWKIDSYLETAIATAKENCVKLSNDIIMKRRPFRKFGKSQIQKQKVNPDTFVQMALQLAYYRLHNKSAPTYETATTRKYRLGRTETLRSGTSEAQDFVCGMDNPKTDISTKRQLLRTALATHDRLMREAKEGFGCDRHLMGLSILSSQAGPSVSEIPAIKSFYCDPAFVKSGGGGNYILSTSTSGYTAMSGGATAMVTDGYGIFYNFEPQQIWVWITNFRRSFETSAEKFDKNLDKAFVDMMGLLASEKSKI